MLLSDHDIRVQLKSGRITLDPCNFENLQPSSIDVRLDSKFKYYKVGCGTIDPRRDQAEMMASVDIPEDGFFMLPPHGFALGSTLEKITLGDDVASRFEGKSSLGRLGLLPHVAAGFIDPGFDGYITLELHNVTNHPMMLFPGMKIGQLCFFALSSPAALPYGSSAVGSKYQGQSGPTTSRYHLNYKK